MVVQAKVHLSTVCGLSHTNHFLAKFQLEPAWAVVLCHPLSCIWAPVQLSRLVCFPDSNLPQSLVLDTNTIHWGRLVGKHTSLELFKRLRPATSTRARTLTNQPPKGSKPHLDLLGFQSPYHL